MATINTPDPLPEEALAAIREYAATHQLAAAEVMRAFSSLSEHVRRAANSIEDFAVVLAEHIQVQRPYPADLAIWLRALRLYRMHISSLRVDIRGFAAWLREQEDIDGIFPYTLVMEYADYRWPAEYPHWARTAWQWHRYFEDELSEDEAVVVRAESDRDILEWQGTLNAWDQADG